MTRRRDMMCEDLFGCEHEPETPILDANGNIDHWRCRCGRRALPDPGALAQLPQEKHNAQ